MMIPFRTNQPGHGLAALLAGLVILTSACSSSSDSDAMREVIRADALTRSLEAGEIEFDGAEAGCFADELIDRFSMDRLEEWGYRVDTGQGPAEYPPDWSAEEAAAAFGAADSCVDVEAKVVGLLELNGFGPAVASCMASEYVASGLLDRVVFAGFDADLNAAVDSAITDAAAKCDTSQSS